MSFHPKDDPYHDRKKYHMAHRISSKGGVSALCFRKPRAINLAVASWAFRPEAVTCKKCLQILALTQQDSETT